MKSAVIACVSTVPQLLCAMLVQAPSFALYTSATAPYVAEEISFEDSAKAQSLAYTMTTFGAVLASLVAGRLYDIWTVRSTLWFGCAVSAAGCAVALAGLGRKGGSAKKRI